MRLDSVRVLSVALAIAAVGLLIGSAQAAPRAGKASSGNHEIGVHGIDGFRVAPDTTYRRALRRFGPLRPPLVSVTFRGGDLCVLTATRVRLTLVFGSLNDASAASCTWFLGAVVTGHAWRTPDGLKVGAPLQTMRARYPTAVDTGLAKPLGVPTWSAEWWLTPTDGTHAAQPVLMAYTKHQRVIALAIGIVGH